MTSRASHLRRAAALLATAMLATTAVACGGDSGDDLPPPASPGGPPPRPPAADPAHQPILDTYYGSVDATVAAQEAGDPDYPDLALYFLESAQAHLNTRSAIERHEANGAHYTGRLVVVSAEVTELDEEADPPTAVVEACLDDSGYQLVFRDDGSPVPSTEPGGRYTVTSQAILGTDDRWYIATTTSHWDQPC